MSERKTAEIKFRVTPTFKAALQSSAAEADESMSEYIEAAVTTRQRFSTSALARSISETFDVPTPGGIRDEQNEVGSSVEFVPEECIIGGPAVLSGVTHVAVAAAPEYPWMFGA